MQRTRRFITSTQLILLILILMGTLPSLVSLIIFLTGKDPIPETWWVGWLQNFGTEMIGAVVTFVLLELIIAAGQRRREEQTQREQARTTRLLEYRQADSPIERRRILDRLNTDDLLSGTDLSDLHIEPMTLDHANFSEADLSRAHLSNCQLAYADFSRATLAQAILASVNLRSANLSYANIERIYGMDSDFSSADMRHTNLWGANLRLAQLQGVNMQHARLSWTNLDRADLTGADLRHANLNNVVMSSLTILPDKSYYRDQPDLERFTNPRHADFWSPS